MHVISLKKLKQFWQSHPTAEVSLRYWYKLTTAHQWQCFNDIVKTFSSADKVKNFVVFDIGGNSFRLITYVNYVHSKVFIRDVLTHAEYDKQKWKKDDWYQ